MSTLAMNTLYRNWRAVGQNLGLLRLSQRKIELVLKDKAHKKAKTNSFEIFV